MKDCEHAICWLYATFGFSKYLVVPGIDGGEAAIMAISRDPSENYLEEYIPRCFNNPIARLVKIRDLENNYNGLYKITGPDDRIRLSEQYGKALAMAEK